MKRITLSEVREKIKDKELEALHKTNEFLLALDPLFCKLPLRLRRPYQKVHALVMDRLFYFKIKHKLEASNKLIKEAQELLKKFEKRKQSI